MTSAAIDTSPKWNGNTMGGTTPRLADDAYFTPDALALAICRKLWAKVGTPELVIEPSAGAGAFVRGARTVWPSTYIVACEPNRNDDLLGSADEINWTRWENFPDTWDHGQSALIIGNPPFSLAEEHIALALKRLGNDTATTPQPRYLTMLLRASFLAGKGRFESLHKTGCLRYAWHVIGRPAFTPDGKTDAAEYVVLTWQAGYRSEEFGGGWLEWKGKASSALAVAGGER